MNRTIIRELKQNINLEVMIEGYVHKIRKLGKIAFVVIRDRSGLVQTVVNTKEIDIKGLKLESIVKVIGTVNVKYDNASEVEVSVKSIEYISEVKEDIPIEINKEELEANIDTILNNRVLSLRHPKVNAAFKVEAALVHGFSEFLESRDFTQVFTPKIVAEGTEGGTELFKVQYFEKTAYLAQSPQFYKQMLVGSGFERVYEIGHVFRAEEHNTLRHLNEYVGLDFEMGFINDERDIMQLETELLKYMINKVQTECSEELKLLNAELPQINGEIPSMEISKAIEVLKEVYGKEDLKGDLDPEGEKLICKYVKEKYNSDFIFLTNYPASKRPMYTMPNENGGTHSFDLLFRGLEITTGGQRIHNYEKLRENMIKKGLDPEKFVTYLEVFKYGVPPHGGLGIGLERLTAQLLGIKNVRETTLFPRDRERITP